MLSDNNKQLAEYVLINLQKSYNEMIEQRGQLIDQINKLKVLQTEMDVAIAEAQMEINKAQSYLDGLN